MCSAIANPEDVTFVWKILEDNYTEDAKPAFETGLDSYLVLDRSFHMLRTYICYTNNSVGESTPCEIQVPGEYSNASGWVVMLVMWPVDIASLSRYIYFDLDHGHITFNIITSRYPPALRVLQYH